MLTQLGWLPPAPLDFRDQVSALVRSAQTDQNATDLGERVMALATAGLDETQLRRLAILAGALVQRGRPVEGLSSVRVGLLGDGTLSLLAPAIVGSGLRHGVLLDVVEGGYGAAVQEALDTSSALHAAALDMAVIACDARSLGLNKAAASPQEAIAKVDGAEQHLRLIINALRPSVASTLFVQTLTPPTEPLFGSYDRVEPGAPFAMVEALNRRIADWAATGQIALIDIARLAATAGYETWDEPRHWHASKLSFSPHMIPIYADVVARTVAAACGKARKCLVLDLDNTLWGGVIGDDGVGGITLGQGSGEGEAFLAIQQMALDLRARGIVLAVCSKNDEDIARAPFREHPDMLLREDHIAVFQANWTDKAANLRAIAKTLNIGLDALVLLDDNPAERLQVRREIPLVAAPELPDDPALFPRMLMAAGYFEALTVSQEDRERAGYYQANAQRAAALSATDNMDAYLGSLEMVCTLAPVDQLSRARVSQLINKSNQFNLTTTRYAESEILEAEQDPLRHAVQIRLVDRFGDNGIISVLIAQKSAHSWSIDTWLMSCRVLGRRVQEAALAHLAMAAKREGASALIGRYIPSAKNRMVADHYQTLGFERIEAADDGVTVWRLNLNDFQAPELPMQIYDLCLQSAVSAP